MCRTSLRSSRGASGSLLTNRSVRRMTPSLKLRPQLDAAPAPAGDLDAAAADVDDDRDFAGRADAVDRRQMDEPGFLGAGNDARPDACLAR